MKGKNKRLFSSIGSNEEYLNKNKWNVMAKVFISLHSTMGIDRLYLYADMNNKFKKCIRIYIAILNLILIGVTATYLNPYSTNKIYDLTRATRHVLLYILARFSVNEMDVFFVDVHKGTVNITNVSVPKGRRMMWTLLVIGTIIVTEVGLYAIMLQYVTDLFLSALFVIYEVAQIVELFLFGYLMTLMYNRIRIMTIHLDFIKETINMKKNDTTDVSRSICKMSQNYFNEYIIEIMEFYDIGVQAMNRLIKIIQWPMIVLLGSNFVTVLCMMYTISLLIMHDVSVAMSALILIRETITISALFVPCVMCERIGKDRHRVKLKLQHMLFSRGLDDKGRRLIRSFLVLIEENDLSVTLLKLFDLNIGLPLNFLALILCYLIVLLQFERVLGF